ncbi:hypothetical protein GC087_21505 [Pantoea sp. JZ2]|uniref:hypothetical protein n=1 Tax=Pantoea sp. JZ2 TaxID=2654189 RepID=UPI002B48D412|nr:hypothetical protein [Pantoea sp. JZ2]WRH14987.1 hypothetical protein GC087_21505 [Pantoea sp. JZ2]
MTSILENNRNYLVAATINSMLMKNGHKYCTVKLSNGESAKLQINETKLIGGLVHFFEAAVYESFSRDDADNQIRGHYQNCLNKNKDRLTSVGVEFMNGLIENVAEEAFASSGDK